MPTYRANLDRLAATGLPIQVTELDVDGTEDAVQLAGMQKIFPIYWEHPAVTGVTLWGYKQFSHWRQAQGAWLVWSQAGSEGAERPAMQWIHKYVNNNRPNVLATSFCVAGSAANGSTVGTVAAPPIRIRARCSRSGAPKSRGIYAGANGNGCSASMPATAC